MASRGKKTRGNGHKPHASDDPPKPTDKLPKAATFSTVGDRGTPHNEVNPNPLEQTEGGTIQFVNEIGSPALVLFKPGPVDMSGDGLVAIGDDWYMLVLDPADADGSPSTSAPITVAKRTPHGKKKRQYTVLFPGNADGNIGSGTSLLGPDSAQDPEIIIGP